MLYFPAHSEQYEILYMPCSLISNLSFTMHASVRESSIHNINRILQKISFVFATLLHVILKCHLLANTKEKRAIWKTKWKSWKGNPLKLLGKIRRPDKIIAQFVFTWRLVCFLIVRSGDVTLSPLKLPCDDKSYENHMKKWFIAGVLCKCVDCSRHWILSRLMF